MKKTIILLCLLVAARAQAQDAVAVKGVIAVNLPSKSVVVSHNDVTTSNSPTAEPSDCLVELSPDKCYLPNGVACYITSCNQSGKRYKLTIESLSGGGYRFSYDDLANQDGKYHFDGERHDTKEETISSFVYYMYGGHCTYVFK